MNTLVLAPFSTDGLDRLRRHGDVVLEPWTKTQVMWDPEELAERIDAEGFGALVVEADFLFEELFSSAPRLRFAAICRGALNQVDLDAATDAGVVIVNTPGRNAQAVAELVVGQLFALARHLPAASTYVHDGSWDDPVGGFLRFQGRELAGATLGLVGFGAVGRQVARMARGLGMRVLAHDPYVKPGSAGTAGVTLTDLDTLLRESAYVSVHVPETPATAGMLSAERLAALPDGACVVNVTSSTVVDQHALAAALRSGRLGGAALDVHDAHPIPPDSPFIGMPNVLLTPHIGGDTVETVERHSAMVASDLERYLRGQRPKHLANPDVWARRRR